MIIGVIDSWIEKRLLRKLFCKMKRRMKILLPISIIIGFLSINIMHTEHDFRRIYNPDLSIVKDDWQGNVSANGRFYNDTVVEKAPMREVLKWKLRRNPQRKEKKRDTFQLQMLPIENFEKNKDYIVWLGHSSFVISINGILLLTDPVFFNLPNAKRKMALPCNPDNLKNIDYLLISHDHRDHFDEKSVKIVTDNNPKMKALIPLNGSRLFNGKKLNATKRQEAAWFQEYNLTNDIRIVFLPAKHWGRRGLNDFNKTLWGSFLIINKNKKIFFAGDSAYDEHLFKEIRQIFGDIDICLLPIGAYSGIFPCIFNAKRAY